MSVIRVRRLTPEWEAVYGSGRADYIFDIYAVAQIIKSRLLLFTLEWWEDQKDGLPLWTSILGTMGANKAIADRLITERILTTPYVTGIKSFTSRLINRDYRCWVSVNTEFGVVTVSNVLPVATPVFNMPGGEYGYDIYVSITCATPGAVIRYTTDGTAPRENSPIYTETLFINRSTTISAKAFKAGMSDSAMAYAQYFITYNQWGPEDLWQHRDHWQ